MVAFLPTNRLHFRKDKTNVRRLAYLSLLLFADPPAWPGFALGTALVTSAVLLHGWAAGYLARAGYAEREKILTVRGPYRHTRNPYYLAHLAMDLGFFVLAGRPLFYLLYFPVIFSVYRTWVINEEQFLEREFGEDYLAFKRDVPGWAFRLTPGPARGSDLRFKWSTFKLNRELGRAGSHLALLAGFIVYFLSGNPFSDVTLFTRLTVIAAVALWLVVHDIYPEDVSRVRFGWTVAAFGTAVSAIAFLIQAPVWQPFAGAGAWIAIAVGLYFAGVVLVSVYPGTNVSQEQQRKLLSRSICQWYLLGLALGLLSCTLGGVWLGMIVPLTFWALSVAGVLSVKSLPQRFSLGLALSLLFASSAVIAVARQLDATRLFFSALR